MDLRGPSKDSGSVSGPQGGLGGTQAASVDLMGGLGGTQAVSVDLREPERA